MAGQLVYKLSVGKLSVAAWRVVRQVAASLEDMERTPGWTSVAGRVVRQVAPSLEDWTTGWVLPPVQVESETSLPFQQVEEAPASSRGRCSKGQGSKVRQGAASSSVYM